MESKFLGSLNTQVHKVQARLELGLGTAEGSVQEGTGAKSAEQDLSLIQLQNIQKCPRFQSNADLKVEGHRMIQRADRKMPEFIAALLLFPLNHVNNVVYSLPFIILTSGILNTLTFI